jgi:Uma2 family endonuclease
MSEYIENGVRLGWLIDPLTHTIWVYRPGREVEEILQPSTVSAAPELPGFELKLGPIWQ